MATHECPVTGCTNQVAYEKLMCWHHWRMVPRYLQSRVYRDWHGYQAGSTPPRQYLATRQEAIDAVNAQIVPRTG